jgi:hypothetical protein
VAAPRTRRRHCDLRADGLPALSATGAFARGPNRRRPGRYHRAMTHDLFRADACLPDCEARIVRIDGAHSRRVVPGRAA